MFGLVGWLFVLGFETVFQSISARQVFGHYEKKCEREEIRVTVVKLSILLIQQIVNVQHTLSYIVFRMAQSEPSSGVKGKAIYNKNLSN